MAEAEPTDGGAPRELRDSIAALEATLAHHRSWLEELQRGAQQAAVAIPAVEASVVQLRDDHARWLGTLEEWTSASVRALSLLGLPPLAGAVGAPRAEVEVLSALAARIDVWAVMQWIADVPAATARPLVSVTVATHDRPGLLQGALDSVLCQSYEHLELIVVDDSVRDDSAELLSSITDPRLRVVRTADHRGAGAAFNAGLAAATGEVIVFLDDDNVMHRDWLRSVVWAFDSFPEVASLYGARIIEDPGATSAARSGSLPTLEFSRYDRSTHERMNYVDRNVIAFRSSLRHIEHDESLRGAYDWDHALRLFAAAPPLALPALASYYRSGAEDRISDRPDIVDAVRTVRSRAHRARPLRVHIDSAVYPVISESYIDEDIRALEAAGAVVTVSSRHEPASRAEGARDSRLDVESAIRDAAPDIVLLHWATHALAELATLEATRTPFACRFHSFDLHPEIARQVVGHPLCAAAFAHPHHLGVLPDGVVPLLPTVGPWVELPEPSATRDLVLSVSAGLPKKDFPLLVEALASLPGIDRTIIVARTNGFLEVPDELATLAASFDPDISVQVNVARRDVLTELARASVLLYTLEEGAAMGFPMSVIEAMLLGAIVVAPDRAEARAIVGDHVRTYRTASDIVRHVREVLERGAELDAERDDLRRRAARHRDPEALAQLHDGLRDGLTQWRYRNGR